MIIRISKLTATFAFLLLTSTSGATTWLVPADQPTIAAGLGAATPGDTVYAPLLPPVPRTLRARTGGVSPVTGCTPVWYPIETAR